MEEKSKPKVRTFKSDEKDWKGESKTFDFLYTENTCPAEGGKGVHFYEHDKTLNECEHDYEYDYDTLSTQMDGFDDCVYEICATAYYQPVGKINNTTTDYAVIDRDIANTNEVTLKYFTDVEKSIPVKALESGFVKLQKPEMKDDTIARVKWGVYYCVEIARKGHLHKPKHLEVIIQDRLADYSEFGTRDIPGLKRRVKQTLFDIMTDVLKNPCDWSDDYNEKYLAWELENMMEENKTPEKEEGKEDCQGK